MEMGFPIPLDNKKINGSKNNIRSKATPKISQGNKRYYTICKIMDARSRQTISEKGN